MSALAFFSAGVSPIPAGAAQDRSAAVIARTSAEAAMDGLLSVLNSHSSTEAFVASSFSSSALQRGPASERMRELDRLKAASGGFDLLTITPRGDRMVEAVARSRRSGRYARFVLFTSSREAGKIHDLFVLAERDPDRVAADRFPDRSVSERELVRLVRKRLNALTEEGSFSGVVLVAKGDRVVLREVRGRAEESWKIPNRADTKFNIASIGKMWIAVAILRLFEQGKLSLDDPVAKWVPSYPHADAARAMTVRHLLQHQAGLGEWDGRTTKSAVSPAAAAATMVATPGESGKAFAYSNAGYVLLGAVVEAVTGSDYQQVIAELVFAPAGMRSSGFWPVTAIVPNRATGYLHPGDDPLGFGPRLSNEQFLGYRGDPSGGGYSTIDDLLAFHRAFAAGKLVRAETATIMTDRAVEFAGAPRPMRYGLGLRLEPCAGVPTIGHSGGGAGSGVSAATYASANGEWTIIVLGNVDPMPEQVALDVCELVHRR